MRPICQGSQIGLCVALFISAGFVGLGPVPCRAASDSWSANLTVATNADGRLELFEVDGDGGLRHRWQRESLHDWSAWSGLGGPGGPFLPGFAAVNDSSGRLWVFAVNRNTQLVMYSFQKAPNSAWSDWFNLPTRAVRPPLAAIQDGNGFLEVFAVGAQDGVLCRIRQGDTRRNWSDWAEMGGDFEPGPVVVRSTSGALEVFAIRARDHSLARCWQMEAGALGAWSSWSNMNESILPGFAIEQNIDGRLELFGVNAADGQVGHTFQCSAAPEAGWSKWLGLGVTMRPGIAVGRCRDGHIEIFTVSPTNNMIYHAFQSRAGATNNWSSWTDMSLLGGLNIARPHQSITNRSRWADIGGDTRAYPVIGRSPEDTLEIFALDSRVEDEVNHRRQIAGALNWTDWLNLDATTTQYTSRAWRTEDGLPDNRVQAIAQTRDGYLWVGTRNGLAKFDGAQFVPLDVKTIFGLTNSSITCLRASPDGALWIGSESEGLARLAGGQAVRYTKKDGLAGDRVTALAGGGQSLWIGTTAGLSHYQGGKFVNYTHKGGLAGDNIRDVLQDFEGRVWISTDRGLNCLKGGHITLYTDRAGSRLPAASLTGIWQDVPGRFWVGSDRGLILIRGNGWHDYDSRYGLPDRLVSVICNDSQGNLWVGNNGGLDQFKEGRFIEELDEEGNSFGKVNALFDDQEGNLWVGSQEGLFLLTPKRLSVYGRQQHLTHNNITAVAEGDAGGLWIGTWGGGLDEWKDEAVTAHTPENGFPFDLISTLCKGRDGSLWVSGPAGSGVIQLWRGTEVYRTHKDEFGGAIKVMHEDRQGNLWIGSSRGVSCLNAGRLLPNHITSLLKGDSVHDMAESTDGTLWFGTESGLVKWKDGQSACFSRTNGLSDDDVTALHLDDDQVLWIGTENGGLNRLKNGRFSNYKKFQGLFSNEIYEILEDDFGWLWMSCSKGVFRVRKQNLDDFDNRLTGSINSIAYGQDDGMPSVLCSDAKPGACKTRDGRLWFPTGEGLVAFDPRVLKVNNNPPPVCIESLLAGRRPVPPPVGAEAASVPPGRGDLEFHYTAVSFQPPERIRFRYKLEGVDSDWIEAGTRRVAYYNNLGPGRYCFRVTACNSDGVWNDAGASASIILLPHFWQKWWFRLLAVTAVTGLVAGTARQVTRRRMQRKLELLEQRHAIEKERLRIAQDIHDDLGGSLTQIALLGELALGNPNQAARHLAKITNSARLNVRALDEIVWAVHPGNDTLNSLVLYLWQFADEFFGPTGIRCRVEAPPNIPAQVLSSDLRHNIFLAVKEAFNNILKHAGAMEVRLRFAVNGDRLAIVIEDNGRGFQPAAVNGSGHGLANMRGRVGESGGTFALTSEPGRGARIEFVLHLKNHHGAH